MDSRPIYEVDPPELPVGWHESPAPQPTYSGPYGSKVILSRRLPRSCWEFSVPIMYRTKVSAHRHVAFKAYIALYEAGLLNKHLLPLMSTLEPEKEQEVQEMLKDVERRAGMASVDLQMDPWAPSDAGINEQENLRCWYTSRLCIGDLPALVLFTRSEPAELDAFEGPTLYRPGFDGPTHVTLKPIGKVADCADITKAQEYTRRVFWSLSSGRMDWENLDFAYLFYPEIPVDDTDIWVQRRAWLEESRRGQNITSRSKEYVVHARAFGDAFQYAEDPTLVLKEFGRPQQFVGWRQARLTEEQEEEIKKSRPRSDNDPPLEIRYPLLVVKPFHPRCNFLLPTPTRDPDSSTSQAAYTHLMPEYSGIALISSVEVDYAFLLPSVLRSVGNTLTMISLRSNLFASAPSLRSISLTLLANAMTAPSAGERFNYQRLETLGDTVLKFLVALQVLVEYPFWHEGYLTKRKDHTVSNVRLAKENVKRKLYRWLIRGTLVIPGPLILF